MDGVIIDSEPMHARAAVLALKKYNIDIPINYVHNFIGSTTSYMCTKIVEDFNLDITPEELLAANNEMKDYLLKSEGHTIVPYVTDLIKDLHFHGVKLIIASSSSASSIEEVMISLRIKDYFNGYVSGGMVTRPKPAPDIFLLASLRLGIEPEECIVIEDSCNGVMAAKAAGMTCIGYSNPNSGNQDLGKADYIVEGFDEINYNFISEVYGSSHKEPALIVTTENLIIRELTEEDVDALYLIRSDPEIRQYLYDSETDINVEKDKLRAYIKNVYDYYGFGLWGVFLKSSGCLIGQCGIELKKLNGEVIHELGYLLSKAYQGQGYAFEFVTAVINYCFRELGLNKITAVIAEDNERSIHLAEKVGMKRITDCFRNNIKCYKYEI
jgi:beta-phosphoglucomutase-like phosphatase (HAD superfamily)/GNAT superfamily N-acetyltransferase